jgi:hypothetical protein
MDVGRSYGSAAEPWKVGEDLRCLRRRNDIEQALKRRSEIGHTADHRPFDWPRTAVTPSPWKQKHRSSHMLSLCASAPTRDPDRCSHHGSRPTPRREADGLVGGRSAADGLVGGRSAADGLVGGRSAADGTSPRQGLAGARRSEARTLSGRSGLGRGPRPCVVSVRRARSVRNAIDGETARSSSRRVVLSKTRRTDPSPECRRWPELRRWATSSESAPRRTEIRSQRGMSVSSSRRIGGCDRTMSHAIGRACSSQCAIRGRAARSPRVRRGPMRGHTACWRVARNPRLDRARSERRFHRTNTAGARQWRLPPNHRA